MSDAWGEVLTMNDGTKADVVPLLEDRAALVSIALFGVLAAALVVLYL